MESFGGGCCFGRGVGWGWALPNFFVGPYGVSCRPVWFEWSRRFLNFVPVTNLVGHVGLCIYGFHGVYTLRSEFRTTAMRRVVLAQSLIATVVLIRFLAALA